jgi:TetR/AcrR family transcriptional regulator, ethionamide resistance regulator
VTTLPTVPATETASTPPGSSATAATGAGSPRLRRRPEDAEREILDAADALLRESGYAALSPAAVMSRTGLSRSSFYVYFRDLPTLLARLSERIEGELFAVTQAWFAGDGEPEDSVRRSCQGLVAVYQRHGPLLRALSDAAASDPLVEQNFRYGTIQHFIVAVDERISVEQARGRISEPVPRDVSRALVLMTERYLTDALGKATEEEMAAALETVVEALTRIWTRTLYS